MTKSSFTRLAGIASLSLGAWLGPQGAALAAVDPPDLEIDFEAGQACSFALHIEIRGDGLAVKNTKDRNGYIRTISAGKGDQLTFVNLSSGATHTIKASGSVFNETKYPDGSSDVVATGHNVILLFPGDATPGPSTTLYVGRVTYHADPTSSFTIKSTSGKTVDICAALS